MNRLKNVLYVSKGFPRKGSQSSYPFIGYKLAYLKKNNVNADILWMKKITMEKRNSFTKILRYILISIFPVTHFERNKFIGAEYKIFEIYYSIFSKFWISAIIFFLKRIFNYTILHYHFLWSTDELVYLKKKLKMPSVISVRGSDMHEYAVNNPGSYLSYKASINFADKIIYVSNALRNCAHDIGMDTDKDVVIHNGYDPETFRLTQKVGSVPVFGFVGHFYHVKRVEKLPLIFKYIKNELTEAKMIVVGSDGGKVNISMKKEMLDGFCEFNLLDDVDFRGEVTPDKVIDYYAMMDVLLLPSRNEGFPNVVMEAKVCGIPVVGSNNGGIPEAVSNGGIIVDEGRLFEERFAKAAVYLYKQLPSRQEIHDQVKDYTWNKVILKEIEVYKEVLNRN